MRLLIQRVLRGAVRVGDKVSGEIGPGVLCLVGICATDTAEEVKWASQKILNTRLWDSAEGKPWNVSVKDQGGGVLLVSQFTLHGVLKGNRPDFHKAMGTEGARALFDDVVAACRRNYEADRVQTGEFGAHMHVESVNDGPVTIWLDSDDRGSNAGPGGGGGGAQKKNPQPKQKDRASADGAKRGNKKKQERGRQDVAKAGQAGQGGGGRGTRDPEQERRLKLLRSFVKTSSRR